MKLVVNHSFLRFESGFSELENFKFRIGTFENRSSQKFSAKDLNDFKEALEEGLRKKSLQFTGAFIQDGYILEMQILTYQFSGLLKKLLKPREASTVLTVRAVIHECQSQRSVASVRVHRGMHALKPRKAIFAEVSNAVVKELVDAMPGVMTP